MIRPIGPADTAGLLALNNAHATELSPLSAERFSALLAMAFSARMVAPDAAFLLAFDHGAAYDSPNYLWFRQRYTQFVYVDRVAVSPAMRGRGLARALYAELMPRVPVGAVLACEVNIEPPNPASDSLHASMGFAEVGRAGVGAKVVRYLVRPRGPA